MSIIDDLELEFEMQVQVKSFYEIEERALNEFLSELHIDNFVTMFPMSARNDSVPGQIFVVYHALAKVE